MGDPLDNPPDNPEGEAGPQLIMFGRATPRTKPVNLFFILPNEILQNYVLDIIMY